MPPRFSRACWRLVALMTLCLSVLLGREAKAADLAADLGPEASMEEPTFDQCYETPLTLPAQPSPLASQIALPGLENDGCQDSIPGYLNVPICLIEGASAVAPPPQTLPEQGQVMAERRCDKAGLDGAWVSADQDDSGFELPSIPQPGWLNGLPAATPVCWREIDLRPHDREVGPEGQRSAVFRPPRG